MLSEGRLPDFMQSIEGDKAHRLLSVRSFTFGELASDDPPEEVHYPDILAEAATHIVKDADLSRRLESILARVHLRRLDLQFATFSRVRMRSASASIISDSLVHLAIRIDHLYLIDIVPLLKRNSNSLVSVTLWGVVGRTTPDKVAAPSWRSLKTLDIRFAADRFFGSQDTLAPQIFASTPLLESLILPNFSFVNEGPLLLACGPMVRSMKLGGSFTDLRDFQVAHGLLGNISPLLREVRLMEVDDDGVRIVYFLSHNLVKLRLTMCSTRVYKTLLHAVTFPPWIPALKLLSVESRTQTPTQENVAALADACAKRGIEFDGAGAA